MLNLLPPQKKEDLRQEKKLKLVFILGFLFLASLFCFSLLLIPIKILISGEVDSQKILYTQEEKEFNDSQLQSLEEKIIEANEKISQLDSFYKRQFRFMKTFEDITKVFPKDIYLISLSVRPQPEGSIVNMLGFSPKRSYLIELKDNLTKETNFYEINFPPGNWVEPENINFSASFKIK